MSMNRPLKALMPRPDLVEDDFSSTRPTGRSDSIDKGSESDGLDGSAPGSDDKAVVVLATSELLPLENVAEELAALRRAIQNHDWLVQYGAIELFRRGMIHHTAATCGVVDVGLLHRLQEASLNLRSAMSKNALLALAECFEFAPDKMADLDLSTVVESILNRAACEKKFLRDAADHALAKLAAYVPTARVLTALTSVAGSKNSKLCVAGCNGTMQCLQELKARGLVLSDQEATAALICQLVKFRSGKDAKVRDDALVALRLVRELVGSAASFEAAVAKAVMSKPVAMKVISDTKLVSRPQSKGLRPSGTSLRDNLRLNRTTVE
ncbi:hypothetical protein AaE_013018 [Aphanomyces astaci]|uniref:Uncharacterized protein n=1 Tax=Aphanomyces astaci TaxID=112090 RepID=A0A6A4ZDF7_APHAT|nr:hypothetical protein AaE_013018 [Aphanomyces astaci]